MLKSAVFKICHSFLEGTLHISYYEYSETNTHLIDNFGAAEPFDELFRSGQDKVAFLVPILPQASAMRHTRPVIVRNGQLNISSKNDQKAQLNLPKCIKYKEIS